MQIKLLSLLLMISICACTNEPQQDCKKQACLPKKSVEHVADKKQSVNNAFSTENVYNTCRGSDCLSASAIDESQNRYQQKHETKPPINPKDLNGFKHHIIGVYQGKDGHLQSDSDTYYDIKREFIDVYVDDKSAPIILSLMAYSSVMWRIHLAEDVKLAKVIIAGYEEQSFTGIPKWVPVRLYTHETSNCFNVCSYSTDYFYSYEKIPKKLQQLVPIKPASFQGTYEGKEFIVFDSSDNKKIKTDAQ